MSIHLNGSEAAYLAGIVAAARYSGWLVHHCRPARRADGKWSTPIQGTPGFPDLVLAHPRARRLMFVELKMAGHDLTGDQADWLAALAGAGAMSRKVILPEGYEAFLKELRDLPDAPRGVVGEPTPEHRVILDEARIARERAAELQQQSARLAAEHDRRAGR